MVKPGHFPSIADEAYEMADEMMRARKASRENNTYSS
jgi:hypothetical protein